MTLLACGINHHKTPLEIREQFAFSPNQTKIVLKELLNLSAVNEAVILSTCNRVEIYSDLQDISLFKEWLLKYRQQLNLNLDPDWYFYQEKDAVLHIMRVATGLDSMVLGEAQILGQMKDAFAIAQDAGAIGNRLQRLFQTVFHTSKYVRSDTHIGANPITLGYAAVTLAKRIFSDLSKRNVLLIGAGEMIELTALHLFNQGIKRIIVANRSEARAEKLASRFFGHWINMADIPLYLPEADIVISATGSELPILGKGAIEKAIKARKHCPMFMVDLAVPRDIEPEVAHLEDVYLYNIGDLESIVQDNREYRIAAAKEAEQIVELQARLYMRELQSLNANNLICNYRDKLESLNNQELAKALTKLEQGGDPKQILSLFAHNLINKILHNPCTQLRQAAFDGRLELLALARVLLDI